VCLTVTCSLNASVAEIFCTQQNQTLAESTVTCYCLTGLASERDIDVSVYKQEVRYTGNELEMDFMPVITAFDVRITIWALQHEKFFRRQTNVLPLSLSALYLRVLLLLLLLLFTVIVIVVVFIIAVVETEVS
jgi:hypothetical protein